MLEVNIFIAERNNVYFHKEFIKIQNVINTVKKKKKKKKKEEHFNQVHSTVSFRVSEIPGS